MKKINFLLAATILGTSFAGVTQASAETIDGQHSADVEINGTIGKLDNTDPGVDIPEGSDEWINVTVDTATAFHTTTASKHKNIESADYSIVNNSGRAVAVTLNKMAGTPTYVDTLTINAKGNNLITNPAATKLVADNKLTDLTNAPIWMRLANKDGRFNIDTDAVNAYAHAAKFNYTGTTINSLPANVSEAPTAENYTLTLKFESIQKDGTTVGVTP